MAVALGDFNAKSNNWCKADTTSLEGPKIDTITSNWFESTYSGTNSHT